MKIYIAGKITGLPRERMLHHFAEAENYLRQEGYTVLNPTVLPEGLDYEDYMHICFAMIDICDEVYLLNNWQDSPGAKREAEYAFEKRKRIVCEEKENDID